MDVARERKMETQSENGPPRYVVRKVENASANTLGVPRIPYFATSWASKEDLGVNCDFMGEK